MTSQTGHAILTGEGRRMGQGRRQKGLLPGSYDCFHLAVVSTAPRRLPPGKKHAEKDTLVYRDTPLKERRESSVEDSYHLPACAHLLSQENRCSLSTMPSRGGVCTLVVDWLGL